MKKFRLTAADIRDLATGHGACMASDRITVDGMKVGFMYRETPDNDIDSGWRFLAGDETGEYQDDPDHIGIYDVNTLANYDRDVIPYLHAPIGSRFGRYNATRTLLPDTDP